MKITVILLLSTANLCWSWSPTMKSELAVRRRFTSSSILQLSTMETETEGDVMSRRGAFGKTISSITAVVTASTLLTRNPLPASAADTPNQNEKKQIGISNEEIARIITRDVNENQFMVRADITRSIYDERATFTDEIDTYDIDPWIKGTKRLFVAEKSHVDLVPDSLEVTDSKATFRFTEYLTFNIPFLLPKVYLSGLVELKRDPTTGLITSYQEKWDQDVNTVLLSAKLGGKD